MVGQAEAAHGHQVMSRWRSVLSTRFVRIFLRRRTAFLGLVIIVGLVLTALFAPLIAPYPLNESIGPIRGDPSAGHWLGTDRIGRDVLTRLIYGARISLIVGVLAQALSLTLGIIVGMTAGYFGGRIDMLLMRIVDVLMAFPFILVAILVVAVLGPSLTNVIIAIGGTSWTASARILRAETIRLRELDFVQAAHSLGAGHVRILLRHILTSLVPLIITLGTIGIGTAILAEASLSFLGVGIPPPTPSWGVDLAFAQMHVFGSPHLALVPAAAIFLTVLGFNLFGDGLRDALDPRDTTVRRSE